MGLLEHLRSSEILNFSDEKLTRGDFGSIALLIALYILQGIPIGLQNTIPILLNNRVSYTKIAILSLVTFPFSVKLLWAPLVDFFYFKRLGKRKSWIIPVQVICGLMLLYGSYGKRMDRWLFPSHHHIVSKPSIDESFGLLEDDVKISKILLYFLILYFLLATQDIAVDGWALTILRPHLRVHASACNSAGQSLGSNLAFFIILSSSSFIHGTFGLFKFISHDSANLKCDCHKLSEDDSSDQITTISGFMKLFAIIILVTTFFLLFKRESDSTPTFTQSDSTLELNLETQESIQTEDLESGTCNDYKFWNSYKILRKVIMLRPIRTLSFILLVKYLFFSTENPIDLKLLSYGLSQDVYGFCKSFTIIIDILFPLLISYYIALYGVSTMLYKGIQIRFASLIVSTVFLVFTKYYYMSEHKSFTNTIYVLMLASVMTFRRVGQLLNTVTDVALFNKVSDPNYGAIYMTLLNTLANFGSFYPNYLAFSLMDLLTFKNLNVDGIFIESAVCIVCGFLFIPKFKLMFEKLNFYEERDWTIGNYT